MVRHVTVCAGVLLALTACTATSRDSHSARDAATVAARIPSSGSAATTRHTAIPTGDRALIRALYAQLSRAFAQGTVAGVRAIIATQYPGDRGDVSLSRCTATIKALSGRPSNSTTLSFAPDVATSVPDPTYVLTSGRVHALHPKGRIYATQISITQGNRTSVHKRHQVVLNHRAYQFTAC